MRKLRWNWPVWLGFLFSLLAFMSYSLVFARFPFTWSVPWVNFLLFGISAALLFLGFRRILRDVQSFLGKIVGSIVIFLSVSIFCIFCYVIFHATKQLPASIGAPKIGQKAPQFALRDTQENSVSLATLLSTPLDQSNSSQRAPKGVLLIFYRGYWGPFCNSELRGIQEQLTAFNGLGIRLVAISVDAPEVSAELCRKAGYTYAFLSDPNAEVIRRYDLLHHGGGVNGQDIARPAEFLLDSSGVVRWVDLTEDFRVRATPKEMLKVAKALH